MSNYSGNAFTIKFNKLVSQLSCEVELICEDKVIKGRAIWDTGASKSCISYRVVNDLSLEANGKTRILTPSGSTDANNYLIDIGLPNRVLVQRVSVNDSRIGDQGLDLLIGMDIITLGDFCVSNYNDKTMLTFRIPSKTVTDYTAQIIANNKIGSRHGHGKRKK